MSSIRLYYIQILECSVTDIYRAVKFTIHSGEFKSAKQIAVGTCILRKLDIAI